MNGDLDYVIMQVVCDGLFLHKLPSDFGFFQEKASILRESVKQVQPLCTFCYYIIWNCTLRQTMPYIILIDSS